MLHIYLLLLLFTGSRSQADDDCPGCHEYAWCYASGDPHYTTFDGLYFHFQGSCSYLLSGDCSTDVWKVIVNHEPYLPRVHTTVCFQVNVLYNGHNATITRDAVIVDGTEVDKTGYADGHFNIFMHGHFVAVETPAGMTAYYDQIYYVKVRVTSRWYGKTCGLCAVWDDDQTDDLKNIDHDYSHAKYLEGEAFCKSTESSSGCSDEIRELIAKERCVEELEKIKCPEIDYNKKLSACIYDYCCCGESCLCEHLNTYWEDCHWETNEDKYLQRPCTSTGQNYTETCTVTGDPHLDIFDKLRYTLISECWYLLAKDECDNLWEVHIHNVPRTAGSLELLVSEVKIRIDTTWIHLSLDGMRPAVQKINGEIVPAMETYTIETNNVVVYEDNNIIHLSSDVGIKIYFGLYYLKLAVSERWSGKTCGLCGSFNMDVEDDRILADPFHAQLWAIPGETCPDPEPKPICTGAARERAERSCKSLLRYLQPRCPSLPALLYKQFCIEDVCRYGEEGLCKNIVPFFTDCFLETGEGKRFLKHWTRKCSKGTQGTCVASGDPHYETLDKTRHHFQGVCEYVFVEDCKDNSFKVLTQNSPTRRHARVSSVSKVTVLFDNITIVIDRNQVMLQGVPLLLPKVEDNYSVTRHGRQVTVKVPALNLKVSYDQRHRVVVNIGKQFFGKTCGLCGIWDNDKTDELAMNADHRLMHETFLVEDESCFVPEPPTCNGQDREEAKKRCLEELRKHDCDVVDIMEDLEGCILDVCTIGESYLCEHVRAYVQACYDTTDEDIYNYDPCPTEPPGPTAFCTSKGDPWYRTFDGHVYEFTGVCWYVLAKDKDGETWGIQVKNEQKRPAILQSYLTAVKVLIGSIVFEFANDGSIKKNGADIINTLPNNDAAGCHLFTIEGFVHMDCIETLGFKIKYIGSYIKVEVNERWLGKTSGLCRVWDMDKEDDELFDDPVHANTAAVNPEQCLVLSKEECSTDSINEAQAHCEILNTFSSMCPESVITRGFTSCVSDVCTCGGACLCSSIADFVADCVDSTQNYTILKVWLDLVHICIGQQQETKTCTAMGISHYRMFDEIEHNFQGMCEYVFAADRDGQFQVITDNKPFYIGSLEAVIGKVTILFADVKIIISQTDVTINGIVVPGNVYEDDYTLEIHGNGRAVYTNFGLKVFYDMQWFLKVVLDERWTNQTYGLCGTLNDNQLDDVAFISDHQQMHAATLYGEDCGFVPHETDCSTQQGRDNARQLCQSHLENIACPGVELINIIEYCVVAVCKWGEMYLCPYLTSYLSECFDGTGRKEYLKNPCATEELEELKECNAWGKSHYSTFDDYQHDFQGVCEYVFAADCVDNTWSVITANNLWKKNCETSKMDKVTIIVGELEIVLTNLYVKINDVLVNVFPVIGPGGYFSVDEINGYKTVIFPSIGLKVTYDITYAVSVFVTPRWFDKTCGLCGIYNNDKTDEIEMYSDPVMMQAMALYGEEECDASPLPPPECPDELAKVQAAMVCNELLAKHHCGIDYKDRIEKCAEDHCISGDDRMCQAVRAYMLACYEQTGDEDYLSNPCPEAIETSTRFCTAYGASNYKTFDGLHYTFQGICWYVLSRDCKEGSWEVLIKTTSPTMEGEVTVVEALRIKTMTIDLHMERNSPDTMVNGVSVSLPYLDTDISINEESGLRIVKAFSDTLTVYYIGSSVRIDLTEKWLGYTCGLCGIWNCGIVDDRKLTDPSFAETFAIEEEDCSVSVDTPCTMEDIEHAEVRCQAIRRLSEFCPETIIDRYYDNCINGICDCGESCLCDVIQATALECALHSEDLDILNMWRDLVQICPDIRETGVCTAWGDPHYTTHDNVVHHFQGMCQYVFSADCATDLWKVVTRNKRIGTRPVSVVDEVTFIFGAHKIVISKRSVSINGIAVQPPVLATDYTILTHGRAVEVSTSLGVTVSFIRRRVRVVLHKSWLGKTCGLCGVWDNNAADEVAMATDHQGMQNDFLYGQEKCEDVPDVPTCSSEMLEEAKKKCELEFSRLKCPDVDPTNAIESCIFDECFCEGECICDNLRAYFEDCYYINKDKYYLQDACNPGVGELAKAICSAVGDPHYQTSDQTRHHFQGMCSYIFIADCATSKWKVITENAPWFVGARVSRVKKVTFMFENIIIVIDDSGVMENGAVAQLPSIQEMYKIYIDGRRTVVDTDFGVSLWSDRYHMLFVTVSAMWFNKTCGLCGTWNRDTTDEVYMNSDHNIMQDLTLYGEDCGTPPNPPVCVDQRQRAIATTMCKEKFEKHGCNDVDYEDGMEACILDGCVCGETCVCEHIRAHMEMCGMTAADDSYAYDPCPNITRNDATAECLADASSIYQTFDRFSYLFQGECWYILAQDCDGSWEVQTKHINRPLSRTVGIFGIEAIRIRIETSVVAMNAKNFDVKLNEQLYNLQQTSVRISAEANMYSIGESKILYAFSWTLTYTEYSVKISVKTEWIDRTCGLCANWNFDASDEKQLEDPDFVKTWAVQGEDCSETKPRKCTTQQRTIAMFRCGESLQAFQCPNGDFEVNLEKCISTGECICDRECLCDNFEEFVQRCSPINFCDIGRPETPSKTPSNAMERTTTEMSTISTTATTTHYTESYTTTSYTEYY